MGIYTSRACLCSGLLIFFSCFALTPDGERGKLSCMGSRVFVPLLWDARLGACRQTLRVWSSPVLGTPSSYRVPRGSVSLGTGLGAAHRRLRCSFGPGRRDVLGLAGAQPGRRIHLRAGVRQQQRETNPRVGNQTAEGREWSISWLFVLLSHLYSCPDPFVIGDSYILK